jgi:hypothetical protein
VTAVHNPALLSVVLKPSSIEQTAVQPKVFRVCFDIVVAINMCKVVHLYI